MVSVKGRDPRNHLVRTELMSLFSVLPVLSSLFSLPVLPVQLFGPLRILMSLQDRQDRLISGI